MIRSTVELAVSLAEDGRPEPMFSNNHLTLETAVRRADNLAIVDKGVIALAVLTADVRPVIVISALESMVESML